MQHAQPFWSVPAEALFEQLQTSAQGLSTEEAFDRLGPRTSKRKWSRRLSATSLLISQFVSPIVLLLLVAAGLSLFLSDPIDACVILAIVLVSGLLGFWQEFSASRAVEKLLELVQVRVQVLRDGNEVDLQVEDVVPGDIVVLNAGDNIPGDCRLLDAKDLHISESALTGETFPVEKFPGSLAENTPVGGRSNALFFGTHVVSGVGTAVVMATGAETEFGRIAERLRLRPPETDFEHGVRRFGYLLLEVTLLLVLAIFAINVAFKRPVLESLMFSLALAVGLTPQLLPVIISINLAHGARCMAEAKVIVKRLAAIENFGSMDVLCADKTGTLTEGTVELHLAVDASGQPSEEVLRCGHLNASFESGFTNPLDEALRQHCQFDVSAYSKLDEVPYDFLRKRLSVLVGKSDERLLITKGAVTSILNACRRAQTAVDQSVELSEVHACIEKLFKEFSEQGHRVLGVAIRDMRGVDRITKDDETDMTFLGFLVFMDPIKSDVSETISELRQVGVTLKIITGDNRLVAGHVAHEVGLDHDRMLTGPELREMSDDALRQQVNDISLFAEVEPNQKERIILALKKAGHVVGYLGDGINDAPALHAADVSISVESAVDVAKEAADIILLEKHLDVLRAGIDEGRVTFANTLKYVFMATSANFGNMFSMAGASLMLDFLPLLPSQILLMNLLTDFPEMAIATDRVDSELTERPQRWNLDFIRRFMITFGVLSSVFDYLTFGVLQLIWGADTQLFRAGWFVESVISASAIVLVIRSRRPFFRSRPSWQLLAATLVVFGVTLLLPMTPVGRWIGFEPLTASLVATLSLLVLCYVVAAELLKQKFYSRAQL